ncbi:MAG: DNA adenine methylase [Epsilonproteobacteria bacterium]|nr:DNA adenine methylase [Campylobacterota bacterium]
MNYIGSKLKLSSWIKEQICNVAGSLGDKTFCDIFAGTGIVARSFKKDVKQVVANDLEHYSFVLNRNYIGNHKKIKNKEDYIKKLDNIKPVENGFIYQNYCLGGGSGRQYFSDTNGKKIDAIRVQIEKWLNSKEIDDDMYYFLLASLLESADKVANTASVYGAFLKHLKKSAKKELVLQPAFYEENDNDHFVFQKDANSLIREIKGDILYLDPPYNHRQYSANYHLLNTISLYKRFTPQGKTGLPKEYNRSNYCKRKEVKKTFEDLIKNADFKYIFLSYNNEGLMSKTDIKEIMQKYGEYDLALKEYQRFKANKTKKNTLKHDKTFEYLHILKK